MYIDECGFDAPLIREYGYSKMGTRLMGEKTGKRFNRTSIIAGLRQGKPISPMRFEGYCNTEVVVAWVEKVLIPELSEKDLVVLDHASLHKSSRIKELIEEAGCDLLFLPPYSPDMNPIEQFWSELKAKIRLLCPIHLHIAQAIDKVFHYFWE